MIEENDTISKHLFIDFIKAYPRSKKRYEIIEYMKEHVDSHLAHELLTYITNYGQELIGYERDIIFNILLNDVSECYDFSKTIECSLEEKKIILKKYFSEFCHIFGIDQIRILFDYCFLDLDLIENLVYQIILNEDYPLANYIILNMPFHINQNQTTRLESLILAGKLSNKI